MSEERHPNINAVQLLVDVREAVYKAIRGPAAKLVDPSAFHQLPYLIESFVEQVDEHVDEITADYL